MSTELATAHRTIDTPRPFVWLMGAGAVGVVLAGASAGVAAYLELMHPAAAAAAGLGAAVLLEAWVRLEGRARRAAAKRLLHGIIDRVGVEGAPVSGWSKGLPFVQATWQGQSFTAHLEPVQRGDLRLGLTAEVETPAWLWAARQAPVDYPHRWERSLRTRYRHVEVPDGPEGVVVLSAAPEAVAVALGDAARTELGAMLREGGQRAYTIDLSQDAVGWTGQIDLDTSADAVLARVVRLVAWARQVAASAVIVLDEAQDDAPVTTED